MKELKDLEIFEIELLDILKKSGIANSLVFGGGTMLRLCHGLNRYSVDLDFWFHKETNIEKFFDSVKELLLKSYILTDSQIKYYTILFEIKSERFRRRLKIEIRKEVIRAETEEKIAFSRYSNKQVLIRGLTLNRMMKNKINAFLDRGEIRDCFDMEFLLRKGIAINIPEEQAREIQKRCGRFKPNDFKVTLGSLVEHEIREYYIKHGFVFLQGVLKGEIHG